MSKRKSLKVYSTLLRLYPREHQKEYGDQMLDTVKDMLDDAPSPAERIAVWGRIIADLPVSVCKEQLHTIGDKMHATNNNPQRIHLISALALTAFSAIIMTINRMLVFQGPPFAGLPQPLLFVAVIIAPLAIIGISVAALRAIKQQGNITMRPSWPFAALLCISAIYLTINVLDYISAWEHGVFSLF